MSLKVSVEAGRKLLSAMGFKPKNIDMPEKIQSRLNKVAEYSKGDYTDPVESDDKSLLTKVLKELGERGEVVVEGAEGGNGHSNGNGDKPAKATKKPAAKKEGASRDKYGCRLGTKWAKVNAAITAKPSTIREIVARSELDDKTDFFWPHLNKIVERGELVVVGEGKEKTYRTPPKA